MYRFQGTKKIHYPCKGKHQIFLYVVWYWILFVSYCYITVFFVILYCWGLNVAECWCIVGKLNIQLECIWLFVTGSLYLLFNSMPLHEVINSTLWSASPTLWLLGGLSNNQNGNLRWFLQLGVDPPPLIAQISRHFFTPLFFFCNWILHIWNGFYNSKKCHF